MLRDMHLKLSWAHPISTSNSMSGKMNSGAVPKPCLSPSSPAVGHVTSSHPLAQDENLEAFFSPPCHDLHFQANPSVGPTISCLSHQPTSLLLTLNLFNMTAPWNPTMVIWLNHQKLTTPSPSHTATNILCENTRMMLLFRLKYFQQFHLTLEVKSKTNKQPTTS